MARRQMLRWYVYTGGPNNERIRHEATMRGAWPGYEVECVECGWMSRTGGGVRHWVRELAFDHLASAHGIVRVYLLTR